MPIRKLISRLLPGKNPKPLTSPDPLTVRLSHLLGYPIANIAFYQEALTLRGSNGSHKKRNYERLEFLGDSILGSIVSTHLFEAYPTADEGYLTQMKSKIVNRKNLNAVGHRFGLTDLILNRDGNILSENTAGNILEALVGAVFLDTDYDTCQRIVLERLIPPAEMLRLEQKIISYKGLLLEWAQKTKKTVRYDTAEERLSGQSPGYRSTVFVDDHKIATATDTSKKKAEEKAAQRAFYCLNPKNKINAHA